ncbi:phage portal protein, partial [Rhodobacteraceae bacterium WD3A24]
GGIAEWNRVQLHTIAAGYRVPYELMTGDLSQVNFSSSRVGLNEFRRMVEAMQWQVVIPMFCERIWRWFTEAAWTAGLIPVPEVPVEWGPPRFESVNPLQDAQTDLIEVRAGFATLNEKIAERGYDPQKVLDEHSKTATRVDELGLVFDSDPRKVARAGVAHSTPPDGDGEGGGSGAPPGGGN